MRNPSVSSAVRGGVRTGGLPQELGRRSGLLLRRRRPVAVDAGELHGCRRSRSVRRGFGGKILLSIRRPGQTGGPAGGTAMRNGARGCKENNAEYVKRNAPRAFPEGRRDSVHISTISLVIRVTFDKKKVDKGGVFGIIIFTFRLLGDAYAETAPRRCQAPEPAPAGNRQPAPPGGDRRLVRRQRVLRSPRPGSSQ